jgi:hypothetical protein
MTEEQQKELTKSVMKLAKALLVVASSTPMNAETNKAFQTNMLEFLKHASKATGVELEDDNS